MALQLKLTTPHGITLENAYSNIDFFSFTKRHEGLIFNIVFYRDQEAFEEGLPALPDMIVSDIIPIDQVDLEGNILEQIYEYVKENAKLATDGDYYVMRQETQDGPMNTNLQYGLFKDAEDVFEDGQPTNEELNNEEEEIEGE